MVGGKFLRGGGIEGGGNFLEGGGKKLKKLNSNFLQNTLDLFQFSGFARIGFVKESSICL